MTSGAKMVVTGVVTGVVAETAAIQEMMGLAPTMVPGAT